MSEQYENDPDFISWIKDISKECDCCVTCSDVPCGGVQAGGVCDNACQCRGENLYEFEPECYMDAEGQCSAAGSEYCDWECPNGGC